eukprot:PLAT14518.1.p1 GENE.PLAT14518.1~~PLAT14518.1.p1  ORF type:complete len:319 (+),score=89.76 PLAT14518.1:107-958(+)
MLLVVMLASPLLALLLPIFGGQSGEKEAPLSCVQLHHADICAEVDGRRADGQLAEEVQLLLSHGQRCLAFTLFTKPEDEAGAVKAMPFGSSEESGGQALPLVLRALRRKPPRLLLLRVQASQLHAATCAPMLLRLRALFAAEADVAAERLLFAMTAAQVQACFDGTAGDEGVKLQIVLMTAAVADESDFAGDMTMTLPSHLFKYGVTHVATPAAMQGDSALAAAVNEERLAAASVAGKKGVLLSVEDAQAAQRAAAFGVDVVTSSQPVWLSEWREDACRRLHD